MSNSTANLQRKIRGAGDLQSVVRTMRALAAASIGQYENSVRALEGYQSAIELGLGACFRDSEQVGSLVAGKEPPEGDTIGAIVFGSDQGLVGQFNDVVVDHAIETLGALQGSPAIWAVGDRVHARLLESGLAVVGLFSLPSSIDAIAPLVGEIQLESETHRRNVSYTRIYVFHNRPLSKSIYEPVHRRLLPLDDAWHQRLAKVRWPTKTRPEIIGGVAGALRGLIRESLFISLFRACAESLASENASRLAAMQRADKNIDDLLQDLHATFHRSRQQQIDEELFDVTSGYDAIGRASP